MVMMFDKVSYVYCLFFFGMDDLFFFFSAFIFFTPFFLTVARFLSSSLAVCSVNAFFSLPQHLQSTNVCNLTDSSLARALDLTCPCFFIQLYPPSFFFQNVKSTVVYPSLLSFTGFLYSRCDKQDGVQRFLLPSYTLCQGEEEGNDDEHV